MHGRRFLAFGPCMQLQNIQNYYFLKLCLVRSSRPSTVGLLLDLFCFVNLQVLGRGWLLRKRCLRAAVPILCYKLGFDLSRVRLYRNQSISNAMLDYPQALYHFRVICSLATFMRSRTCGTPSLASPIMDSWLVIDSASASSSSSSDRSVARILEPAFTWVLPDLLAAAFTRGICTCALSQSFTR